MAYSQVVLAAVALAVFVSLAASTGTTAPSQFDVVFTTTVQYPNGTAGAA